MLCAQHKGIYFLFILIYILKKVINASANITARFIQELLMFELSNIQIWTQNSLQKCVRLASSSKIKSMIHRCTSTVYTSISMLAAVVSSTPVQTNQHTDGHTLLVFMGGGFTMMRWKTSGRHGGK